MAQWLYFFLAFALIVSTNFISKFTFDSFRQFYLHYKPISPNNKGVLQFYLDYGVIKWY
jgi:hypothetical protein